MVIRSVNKLAEICFTHGLSHLVISPGSRSAALTLAFARHPGIKTFVIYDERSAGYIALGIAQALKKPVGIVCTSGTAVINLFPAIAESFYQHIPLLVLTADRPQEWIDQADGQSIHQEDIFGKHVKKSFIFPTHETHKDGIWHSERMISEAFNIMLDAPGGPVHINIPLREPFYPDKDEIFDYDIPEKIIEKINPVTDIDKRTWNKLKATWDQSNRILLLLGQSAKNPGLNEVIENFSYAFEIPVIADVLSNYSYTPKNRISLHDNFLFTKDQQKQDSLKPDLILSTGGSVISKNLKLFLRKNKPVHHWHIQKTITASDTFQSVTHLINLDPNIFFDKARQYLTGRKAQKKFLVNWTNLEKQAEALNDKFFPKELFSELEACDIILKMLPENINLHLANSMPVRLVNYLNKDISSIEVFANRGTSGIDGCSSTAVGIAMVSDKMNLLITGDMAFFYDRNAFWHTHVPENLRVIILNNHGGGIFRMIDGPSGLPELREYFETNQSLTAENTASDFGMEYSICNSSSGLKGSLPGFFKMDKKAKILEIETNSQTNKTIFDQFKSQFI